MNTLATLAATAIIFKGLIMHYEYDPAPPFKRAVFVEDKDHVAELYVPPQNTTPHDINDSGWTSIVTGDAVKGWTYEIKGLRLIITGAEKGVTHSTEYDRDIPKLSEALDNSQSKSERPWLDIRKGDKLKNAYAYVDYRDGELSTTGCFERPVIFPSTAAAPRCLAEGVLLSNSLANEVVIVDAKDTSRKITATSGKAVQFRNRALKDYDANNDAIEHYKHFSMLLEGGSTVSDMLTLENRVCDKKTCVISKGTPLKETAVGGIRVECANTNWP